ncbi:hypothetical protein F5B20DRAFT_548104 [Whalleya microplaca]|nr:hypothetical protein F5B20DRAFT_548104 [Whalleya microplaca]
MPIPVLSEAVCPEEDWTGLRDARARRKLQNRLNVRAHRRRKAEARPCGQPHAAVADHQPAGEMLEDSSQPAGAVTLRSSNGPQETPWFPLSPDHLIQLVQYNFIRGILTNIIILGHQNAFPEQCRKCWEGMPLFPAPATIPESLRPTALQRSTPHEPWIDLIPDKRMRDNAIRTMKGFRYGDVEEDMTGGICGGMTVLEMSGILAWNDPWCVEGWELTEGFIKKWPFLVKGCWEWLESTNRWRAIRGEEPLVVEL